MIDIKLTTEQAKCLEDTIESHMYFCFCELSGLDDEIPDGWTSYGPYCGCQTCDTREYLMCMTEFLRNQNIIDIHIDDSKDEESYENTLFD